MIDNIEWIVDIAQSIVMVAIAVVVVYAISLLRQEMRANDLAQRHVVGKLKEISDSVERLWAHIADLEKRQ
jgi:hypothetical protein